MEDLLPLLFLIFWVIIGTTASRKKKQRAEKSSLPPTNLEKKEKSTEKNSVQKQHGPGILNRFKESINSIKEEIRNSVENDLPKELSQKRKTDYTRGTVKSFKEAKERAAVKKESSRLKEKSSAKKTEKDLTEVERILNPVYKKREQTAETKRKKPFKKTRLQNAVVWAEVLGKPKALRQNNEPGIF